MGSAGFEVELHEARPFLGGRAASFPLDPSDPESERIDNCQHVLLRCCDHLLDFYRRLGVDGDIRFHRELYFVEPGGRLSVLRRGPLPAPLHLAGSFARARFLDAADKLAIARGLAALRRERDRPDLDRITMLDWLRGHRQTQRAIDRFWRQVLVSAVNEELDRMSALPAFQVFLVGFLPRADAYEIGVPAVPLGRLYSDEAWRRFPSVSLRLREPVESLAPDGLRTASGLHTADFYICALPPDRLAAVAPALAIDTSWIAYSPITGIHLWFDRPVIDLPHATLLDRTMQWVFNKDGGRYVQLV
ncbi:MAG: FAD-dependent oxidoreductase, partial [Bryobacteraceae bacterium]